MDTTPQPAHEDRKRSPRRMIAALIISAAAIAAGAVGPAQASARPGFAFKVIARNQDELGVWHVTALVPQLVSKGGKTSMETGSVLAQVDCRQRVMRIDAWSLHIAGADEADEVAGWRPPGSGQEQTLLTTVCDGAPTLRGRAHALASSASAGAGVAPPQSPSPVAPVESPLPRRRRFAAQIGLFTSKAAADSALTQAKSRLRNAADLTPLAVLLPGTTSTFRALLAATTLGAAREVCAQERRLSARSTCWLRPISP